MQEDEPLRAVVCDQTAAGSGGQVQVNDLRCSSEHADTAFLEESPTCLVQCIVYA